MLKRIETVEISNQLKVFSGAGYISRRKKILSVCISHYNLKEKIIIVYIFMWIVKSEISFSTSLDDYDQLCIFYVHIDSDAQWIVFIPKDYLVLIAEEDLLCFALLAVQPYRKARNTKQS